MNEQELTKLRKLCRTKTDALLLDMDKAYDETYTSSVDHEFLNRIARLEHIPTKDETIEILDQLIEAIKELNRIWDNIEIAQENNNDSYI